MSSQNVSPRRSSSRKSQPTSRFQIKTVIRPSLKRRSTSRSSTLPKLRDRPTREYFAEDFNKAKADESETARLKARGDFNRKLFQTSDDESTDQEEGATSCSGKGKLYSADFFVEQCITTSKSSKRKTSDSKLSKQDALSIEEVHLLLASKKDFHASNKETLLHKHCQDFEAWYGLLNEGFNIMLYGVGSKMSLVEHFLKQKLTSELHVVIHGFFPGITLKNVLQSITEDVLEDDLTFQTLNRQVEFIKEQLKTRRLDLYLVIHNLDGASLSSEKSLSVLSELVSSPFIHVVATVDHINAGLLFDSVKSIRFAWIWIHVPTFLNYRIESSYENSLLSQQCEELALSSLQHVFHSLTLNAKGIFEILAKAQLDRGSEPNYIGLSFAELFRQCREEFLVNSDLTLRTQLIEFKDHNMLRCRKANDGVEHLQIPVDDATLKQFLEQKEND